MPDAPQTFLSALQSKYAGVSAEDQTPARQIKFSGKVAEEVGFDKIRRQQAQLHELQFVILDDLQVAYAMDPEAKDGLDSIGRVCPKVKELDLSRNLFERFGPIVEICAELRQLRSLRAKYVPILFYQTTFRRLTWLLVGTASKTCSMTRF